MIGGLIAVLIGAGPKNTRDGPTNNTLTTATPMTL
jgi:hypothetical protein